MKVVGILLARMGSSRLPGKSLAQVAGRPMIAQIIERMKGCAALDEIVLASPDGERDRALLEAGARAGATPFAGSEDDVLDRLYQAAKAAKADVVIHIGGDCPFADRALMQRALDILLAEKADYVSNLEPMTFPAGLDTDAITFEALERMWKNATLKTQRVHCLSYIYQHPSEFKVRGFQYPENLGGLRWTMDYDEDLEFVRAVYDRLGANGEYFDMAQILELLAREPAIGKINTHLSDFSPGQPAYWDSVGYCTDMREDLLRVLTAATEADSANRLKQAAEQYAVAETLLKDLAARARALASAVDLAEGQR